MLQLRRPGPPRQGVQPAAAAAEVPLLPEHRAHAGRLPAQGRAAPGPGGGPRVPAGPPGRPRPLAARRAPRQAGRGAGRAGQEGALGAEAEKDLSALRAPRRRLSRREVYLMRAQARCVPGSSWPGIFNYC